MHPRPRGIIAVSRQHGARGAAVARLVAERMGYTCWDRELVAAIAARVRAEPAAIAAHDERCQLPGADEANAGNERLPREQYLRGLELVTQSLARRGGAVIVGRGVGFLLEDGDCLRVRVVCPLEQRITGLADRAQLCRESARATIEYVDRERRAFVLEQHGVDVDDAASFDLVVSTGALPVDAAADVVVTAYHARFDVRRWPRATMSTPARDARALADSRR
jgi:cytidylate kinase